MRTVIYSDIYTLLDMQTLLLRSLEKRCMEMFPVILMDKEVAIES